MQDLELNQVSEIELERDRIAIHIEDATARRLIEGLAVQLNLRPIFVDDDDLSRPELIAKTALIVADKSAAERYRELPLLSDHQTLAFGLPLSRLSRLALLKISSYLKRATSTASMVCSQCRRFQVSYSRSSA